MGERLAGFRTGEGSQGKQNGITEERDLDTVRAGRGRVRILQGSLGIRARGHEPSPHHYRSNRYSNETTLKSTADHIESLFLRRNKYGNY